MSGTQAYVSYDWTGQSSGEVINRQFNCVPRLQTGDKIASIVSLGSQLVVGGPDAGLVFANAAIDSTGTQVSCLVSGGGFLTGGLSQRYIVVLTVTTVMGERLVMQFALPVHP